MCTTRQMPGCPGEQVGSIPSPSPGWGWGPLRRSPAQAQWWSWLVWLHLGCWCLQNHSLSLIPHLPPAQWSPLNLCCSGPLPSRDYLLTCSQFSLQVTWNAWYPENKRSGLPLSDCSMRLHAPVATWYYRERMHHPLFLHIYLQFFTIMNNPVIHVFEPFFLCTHANVSLR